MDKPTVSFSNTGKTKAKKTWNCALTADSHFDDLSKALQSMIESAVDLWTDFTLEELATNAVNKHGLETKTTDMHALGYTHRPKLLELGVITEHKEPEPQTGITSKSELAALSEFASDEEPGDQE